MLQNSKKILNGLADTNKPFQSTRANMPYLFEDHANYRVGKLRFSFRFFSTKISVYPSTCPKCTWKWPVNTNSQTTRARTLCNPQYN